MKEKKAMRKSFKRFAFTFSLTITTFSKFFQAHFRPPFSISTTVIYDNVVVGIIVGR
jgi:hypothetical protein